jgi:hypothetical protein
MQNGNTLIPQILYDINHNYGHDLQVSASGDLAVVSGEERSKQRVLRRLLTAINGYIWHVDYGAGIPNYIGQALSTDLFSEIKSLIQSQIALENSVSQDPAPKIYIQTISGGIFCQINYYLNPTQQPIVLNFEVSI